MRILRFHPVLKHANAQRLKQLCSSSSGSRCVSTTGKWFSEASKDDPPSPPKGEFKAALKKKYSDTLQLPKSDFPMRVSFDKRNEHEIQVAEKAQFDQLYSFQRLWRHDHPEFILHDGPPYANGNVHIGHAVNKILKDFTNRYKLLRGFKVNYIPGWDCHGLPIEMKALKSTTESDVYLKDPLAVREKAREIVSASISSQKESFQRWGVMAEWESVYRTSDKGLLQAELRAFLALYQNACVFRDLKPVFWSPSSESCLAEAELEYNLHHQSPSLFLNLELVDTDLHSFGRTLDKDLSQEQNGPVKAVIWTTTPWTLPSNKAIAFNQEQEYSLVKFTHRTDNNYLIIASHLVKQVAAEVCKGFTPVLTFLGSQLSKFQYRHPWFEDQVCPFLHGDHVVGDKGTGLVHTAPAHGQDDFLLGLKHKLQMDCYVDKSGNFNSTIEKLKGLPVLSGGNKAVMLHLKNKILRQASVTHSYPYDWRTKKPVIVLASMQWFLDTNKIKSTAGEQLQKVKIFPPNVQNVMAPMIESRPYWCISRQRSWGVPIPVLYKKDTGDPYIDESIIDKMCKLIETTGGLDFWWTVPVSDLVADENLASTLEKGTDIFDVWMDSGLTWQMLGNKVADVYLEGNDQFQGWFQSSLLTSVALRGQSPYKTLYVHGFVVDGEGRKMSKSLGNVVDPKTIIHGSTEPVKAPAFGADVLRWWVAQQGSADGSNCTISSSFLKAADDGVQKLRNVLKFLVSFANENALNELNVNNISYDELMYSDQYMLKALKDFQRQVTEYYEAMNYHRVLMRTLHFATTEVSSQYFTWIKDRLYCDYKYSESRKSCIFVLNQIYLTLAKVAGPLLPFLIEESYSHYKIGNISIFRSLWFEIGESTWDNDQIAAMFKVVLDIRTSLNHVIGANNPKDIWVELVCIPAVFKELQLLHPAMDADLVDKCDSELCDILQVSGISLKSVDNTRSKDEVTSVKFDVEPIGVSHSAEGFSLGISKTPMTQCARCRRYCCEEGTLLCIRCVSVMQRILQKQSQQEMLAAKEELKEAMGKKT